MAAAEVTLSDPLTGRIAVRAADALPELVGAWELQVDGVAVSGGRFRGALAAGATREFLLSVETPPTYPGAVIALVVELAGIGRWQFPLPPYFNRPFPPQPEHTAGVRFEPTQAMLSGGKLAAVVTANGLRELRYKGRHLLTAGPRLKLHGDAPETDPRLAELEPERLPVSCDRFTSDGESVECHALVLPRKMELDELEFTQKFTPLTVEAIRYELGFAVPESFAGIPRLGVELALNAELDRVTVFSAREGLRTGRPFRAECEFAAFRDAAGYGLLIAAAGAPLYLTAAAAHPERVELALRVRENSPIAAGNFRGALYFAPLTPDADAAPMARRLRLG